ncbi:hypothetical protein E2C01_029740 [Portunus trituberculatus]|uniref:Uncharacterized protein n=1 Tax=Portunus trituberculatus TaxID=210409 RepID=A0A5B7ET16_PORTR|nr:hypothetical protein [Portunus trituberculatus]
MNIDDSLGTSECLIMFNLTSKYNEVMNVAAAAHELCGEQVLSDVCQGRNERQLYPQPAFTQVAYLVAVHGDPYTGSLTTPAMTPLLQTRCANKLEYERKTRRVLQTVWLPVHFGEWWWLLSPGYSI